MFFIFLFLNILHAHQINTYISCYKKDNKKKKEITPSSFFTTRKICNVFLQSSDLLHKQKMRLKP